MNEIGYGNTPGGHSVVEMEGSMRRLIQFLKDIVQSMLHIIAGW